MLAIKQEKMENKFQATLEYLAEYRGVKAAAICDDEGLVISSIGQENIDAEYFSPLALLILEQANKVLNRLNENPVQSMVIKTNDSWLTIECIDNIILVVNAAIETDELLKVRIGQAVEMIKSHLKDKYPLLEK